MNIAVFNDNESGNLWISTRGRYAERDDWTRRSKDDLAAMVDVVLRFGGTLNISAGEPFCFKQERETAAETAKVKAEYDAGWKARLRQYVKEANEEYAAD